MPGSKEVLNWETGKLEACTKDTCPYAIDGVNHAPFAAFGGWGGGINAKAKDKVKDAAYAFFSYMTQPAQSNVDVTIGETGFNPYRTSQFTYNDTWKKAGMSEDAGEGYLGAIKDSLEQPEHDPRPAHPAEPEVPAGRARRGDRRASSPARSTRTRRSRRSHDGWNDLNEQIGKDDQLKFYKATLGVTALTRSPPSRRVAARRDAGVLEPHREQESRAESRKRLQG